MPYSSNADLPTGAKKLPSYQQYAWRKIFNACHKSGKDEATCFKIAYSQAKKAKE